MTSTFGTHYPIPRRAAAAVAAHGARKVRSARSSAIVVVDDEIDAREALGEALRDEGYEVFLAANGQEGLFLLRRLASPLGVILDVTMPVMNGLELYRIMKATPALADIPVMISTGDPASVPPGVPLVQKPVSLERFLAAVADLF